MERILLGTRDLADAVAVRDRLAGPKVMAAAFDARQPETIVRSAREFLGSVDVVVDLTPSFVSCSVMEAALALGAHYVNTAACPEHLAQLIAGKPLDLAARYVAAGTDRLARLRSEPGSGEHYLPSLL